MPTSAGMHRINWDLRYDMPPAFIHYLAHVTGAVLHDTHWGGEGPLAIPGVYTLKFDVDGKTFTQTVTVKNDPNSTATQADLVALHDLQMKLYQGTKTTWDGFQQIAAMRSSLAEIEKSNPSPEVSSAVKALDDKLVALGGPTKFVAAGRGGGGGGPHAPTFSQINGVEAEEGAVLVSTNGQLKVLDMSDIPPNPTKIHAWQNVCSDIRTVLTEWHDINTKDLVALNAVLAKNNIRPVSAASPVIAEPVCVAAAASAGRGGKPGK
jgi:hypothetical protein